ncbi:MAG: sulfurtransferase [Chloroflexi bacterium]|nr:sulfurtransferase [Chloroflexota bacterium]
MSVKSPLVTTAWLERHLNERDIRIVELRGKVLPPTEPPPHYFTDRAGYEEAHIPNAVFVDWQVDIVEPGSPSGDVAAPERFAALMGALGIGKDTRVVIYDDAASMFACRLRWALRYYGHENVFILDGGWDKWLAEGRPVSADRPQVESRKFVPRVNARLKATAEEIMTGIEAGNMQLIDVRSPAEYAGAASRARHGGHIPTAISIPRNTMVAEDQTVETAHNLRKRFTENGVALDASDTVIYCNSGVSASFGMLALELAGARNLRLYDGSWKEWGNDGATPKETGA